MKRRDFIVKSTFVGLALSPTIPILNTVSEAAEPSATLVRNGKAQCAIFASPETMAADKLVTDETPFPEHDAEMQRRRLRESVNDLERCLGIMSGATIEILLREPKKANTDCRF